jgi:acyl carrier protein
MNSQADLSRSMPIGLDTVELLLEVEESFGFSIEDKDAPALETVGDLYAYILDHRFRGKQDGCLSSVAFYKLRRALMSILRIPRKHVRLKTELAELIPKRRRHFWNNRREALALRLPELNRPIWVTVMSAITILAISLTAIIYVAQKLGGNAATAAGIFSLLGLCIFFYRITIPLATEFHSDFASVGNLTKEILRMNYGAISDECGRASEKEVWESLRSIIVNQIGISRDAITKEVSFVKDLKMD